MVSAYAYQVKTATYHLGFCSGTLMIDIYHELPLTSIKTFMISPFRLHFLLCVEPQAWFVQKLQYHH